jgi:hypothetical protein
LGYPQAADLVDKWVLLAARRLQVVVLLLFVLLAVLWATCSLLAAERGETADLDPWTPPP